MFVAVQETHRLLHLHVQLERQLLFDVWLQLWWQQHEQHIPHWYFFSLDSLPPEGDICEECAFSEGIYALGGWLRCSGGSLGWHG